MLLSESRIAPFSLARGSDKGILVLELESDIPTRFDASTALRQSTGAPCSLRSRSQPPLLLPPSPASTAEDKDARRRYEARACSTQKGQSTGERDKAHLAFHPSKLSTPQRNPETLSARARQSPAPRVTSPTGDGSDPSPLPSQRTAGIPDAALGRFLGFHHQVVQARTPPTVVELPCTVPAIASRRAAAEGVPQA